MAIVDSPFDRAPEHDRPATSFAGLRKERILASPRFLDGRFRNTARVGAGIKGNPLPLIGEYFFANEGRVPTAALPMDNPRAAWAKAPETGLRATWLGHSTVLLELDGFRVLTDPVFGERASPFSFMGPKRFHPTPVSIAELPPLDAVLVSHDHYDHLCRKTVTELGRRGVPFVTSLGVGAHLEAWGVPAHTITELDWWEEHVLQTHKTRRNGALSFTAAPSQHFSGRGPGHQATTLWSSFRIRTDRRSVFFSGDTGLTPELEDIGRKLGPFDLVMLEVGAFHPSWGDIHLGPENALIAHRMLGSGTLLPVHWGTFNLALHAWDDPAETLLTRAEDTGVRLVTPLLGAATEPGRVERPNPWWRTVERRGVGKR